MSINLVYPINFCGGVLTLLGQWWVDKKWQGFYKVYMCTLHFIFSILHIATMYVNIYLAPNWNEFTSALYMSITETVFMAKAINLLLLGKHVMDFIKLVQTEVLAPKTDVEIHMFKQQHRHFYIIEVCYISMAGISALTCFITTALSEKWELPYPAKMPFELNSQTYWYAYTFQVIGMTVSCLSHVSIDMVMSYMLYHISMIYRLLALRLENIGNGTKGSGSDEEAEKLVLEDLKELIKMHKITRKITLQCESFLSIPLTVQCVLGALMLCFTGYEIINLPIGNNTGKYLASLDLLIELGFQVFFPCHYAAQITYHSGLLSESLYNSNWIGLSKKCRRTIYLYMEFLKYPAYIRAGKFFHVGYPLFTKTINNAYSYLAVLVQMKD